MPLRTHVSNRKRWLSLFTGVMLIMSILFVGMTIQIPNVGAGSVNHNVGNVDILWLTDYGRICSPLSWNKPQTTNDPLSGLGFIGLVIDQDDYNHLPGAEDVADSFAPPPPYTFFDDFTLMGISMITDDGTTQKSKGYFQNVGPGTGDPNDIFVEQTVWTVVNKDWAILQWKLNNLKATDITGVCIGLELPISQVGAGFGLGGASNDGGDDIDGFDATNGVYWASDTAGSGAGTTIGFGSAIAMEPITHYFAEDYHAEYQNPGDTPGNYDPDPSYYVNFFANDTWLYNRLRAANATATDGVTPGNITATVGWNDVIIPVGSSRTFTLVMALNDTFDNMKAAIEDARYYFHNVATGFLITEFSDSSSGTQQIEVFNFGRGLTNLPGEGYYLSVDDGISPLIGTWSNNPLPPYEHAVFTVSGGTIGPEGDTIGLYHPVEGLMDEVAYGQEGIAPDPLQDESVTRRYGAEYTNSWLRNASSGPSFGVQNDVESVISSPIIVINRVMFNPIDSAEGYVELMYKGTSTLDISGYRIVCDAEYMIPPGTPALTSSNRYHVLTQSNYPAGFDLDDGIVNGDNVYLYDDSENLLDMVGWSSPHTQGYFISRMPDGNGTHQGFNDATSIAAEWVFDQIPSLMLTEFFVDGTSAQIEVYNPRGGEKVLDAITPRWNLESTVDGGGALVGTWSPTTIHANRGYSTFTLSSGSPGDEGDTISLFFNPGSGPILMDEVSFGTYGIAPDPVNGESTSRYWDNSMSDYTDDWTREDTNTFGFQNDVPAIDPNHYIVLNEVMFNPSSSPDGRYVVIFNRQPGLNFNVSNFYLVCDDVYQLPSYPVVPGGFDGNLYPNWSLILRYDDDLSIQPFFDDMDSTGDNIYLYDSAGQLLDMMGWNTAHAQGMCARRIPDGDGTFQGHDDATSEAASWVFDTPLHVLITEISDSGTSPSQIEIYNPWYPSIDFFNDGFTLSDSSGGLSGSWSIQTADSGEYAVFDVDTSNPLDTEGDTITMRQYGHLVEEISYGTKGTVPDPLSGESVQRYWDGSAYSDVWERNLSSGPNFGSQNDVPPANFTSVILLNEVLFFPNANNDYFVEVYNRGATPVDISGYKIVGDSEFIIPSGTILDYDNRYFYLLYGMANSFFEDPNGITSTGDNVYLYDASGALLDMVGWNTQHAQGGTVCRVPNGNGTKDGYDDISSVSAGWKFDCTPSVRLIKISAQPEVQLVKYGHLGKNVTFNLTITNLQLIGDIINILNSSEEGWRVEIFDETGNMKITDIMVGAGEDGNITVIVRLPDSIPPAFIDNITITIRSSTSQIIGDSITLNVRVYPFLNLSKTANPDEIYINGAGFNEVSTLTLNMTGMGAQVAVRKYLDTVFCIDSSGSMEWTDPFNLRILESQNFVMENFEIPDRGAVIDFDTVATLQPMWNPNGDHLSTGYKRIIDNLALIDSYGGTIISTGLNLSNEELRLYGQSGDHILNIILITDAANNDPADNLICLNEANIAASRGVIIFTIGLAMIPGSPEEQLLKDIANITGGMYFPAPDASFFKTIYGNISRYLEDLAAWDDDISDPKPMVRDVLPSYIELVPGTFSIPPDNIYIDFITGETFIEWNVQRIKIGETWSVSFDIKSNLPGVVETNVYSASRAYYMRWDNTTTLDLFPHCFIDVLPAPPLPPKLYIDILPNGNDIYLYWDEPESPGIYHYLIYQAQSPIAFDFSSPWIDTSVHIDPLDPGGVAVGDRLTWNHTGAADPSHGNYSASDQWYYCVRAVNSLGQRSRTSRTVGAWTKIFPAGNASFSLPLEPLTVQNTEFSAQDMNARLIKYMDPGTHEWVQHDKGEAGDIVDLVVGKGYETDFTSATRYTFLGLPGAMIRFNSGPYAGFDHNTDAKSLSASVDSRTGDVTLSWDHPLSVDQDDYYEVYRSTKRDGFDDGSAILLSTVPNGRGILVDPNVANSTGQYYYMVIPVNETGVKGASTYSIGVWTAGYQGQYDTIGIPLILTSFETADWYCENIPNTVGINYFIYHQQRWGWHVARMSKGAYDPVLIMIEAYQISCLAPTKFSFIGY
ncbi:MAG: lamin tail domain-containing protein [Thermoplasmata archaeon]|nr:MAG: lamin tail domain-containing protein [Thermoplasmata archaeon]